MRKYQRYDEGATIPIYDHKIAYCHVVGYVTCNICKKNPPTRRWEQCCMGPGAECAAYESPPGCSPMSSRMATCGVCRAKRRSARR